MSATIDRSGWKRVRLGEALTNVGWCNYSHLQPRQVRKVTQGDDTGEVSITTDYYHPASPVVLFGDHTCNVKYVDFDCLILGDGVKLLTPNHEVFSTRFLYYLVQYVASKVPQGYARHLAVLKETECALPCYEDQFKIANAITSIDTHISALQALIAKYEAIKKATVNLLLEPKAGWKRVKLGEVCELSTTTIPTSCVDAKYYVGTENMLLNCQGVSTNQLLIPYKRVRAFVGNDILISNIRPYLKKIWLANKEGGCSSDVNVIRCVSLEVESEYIFYVLAQDIFFDFVMANAIGTKMPRGDKRIIRSFELFLPSVIEQRKIAEQIAAIDNVLADYKAQLEKARQLKTGMMSYFFGQSAEEV